MTDAINRKIIGTCSIVSLFTLLSLPATAQTSGSKDDLLDLASRGMATQESKDASTTLDDVAEQDKFERSFEIPDTPMRIRFFGYVSGTLSYDLKDIGTQDTIIPSATGTIQPGIGDAHFRLGASRTNWGFEVRTPVPGSNKPLKLVIISGYSPLGGANSSFRESHVKQLLSNDEKNIIAACYVEMGNFLAGQYATNFMDISILPELLNFGGNAGAYGIAAPQFRYSFEFGCKKNNKLSISIENPETDYTLVNARPSLIRLNNADPFPNLPNNPPGFPLIQSTDGSAAGLPPYFSSGLPSSLLYDAKSHDRVPDLVMSFTTTHDWGHIFMSGMVRELRVDGSPVTDAFTPPAAPGAPINGVGLVPTLQREIHAHAYSYGLNLAGKIFVGCERKDNINGHIEWGYGLGRYALGTATQTAWIDLEGDRHKIERIYSLVGNIAYQHYWTEHVHSTLLYGFIANNTNENTPNIVNKWAQSFVFNLMYAPVPIIRVGIEYIHQTRTYVGEPVELGIPKRGNIDRVEAQARLYF